MNFAAIAALFSDDDYSSSTSDDELIINYVNIRKAKTFHLRIDHSNLWDESDFLARFRISKVVTQSLVHIIQDDLRRASTRNHAVSPVDQVLLTLQFLASGSLQRCVGDMSGLHKSTVSRIIFTTTRAIARNRPRFIYMPRNQEEMLICVNNFYKIARFPKVIGAIDCTHCPLQSPGGNNAEEFRNRKGYFSINVQAVADANMLIRSIVARWPGASHDSHIFNSSGLKGRFEDGEFHDYVLIGDSGYALKKYLLTPLLNPLNVGERMYNESQIRTRNVIERTFGVLKRRFPALGTKLKVKINRVEPIIVAASILHNMCRLANVEQPPDFFNILEVGDMEDELSNEILNPENGDNVRQIFINSYFTRLANER